MIKRIGKIIFWVLAFIAVTYLSGQFTFYMQWLTPSKYDNADLLFVCGVGFITFFAGGLTILFIGTILYWLISYIIYGDK